MENKVFFFLCFPPQGDMRVGKREDLSDGMIILHSWMIVIPAFYDQIMSTTEWVSE